jgi:hypothetical protein
MNRKLLISTRPRKSVDGSAFVTLLVTVSVNTILKKAPIDTASLMKSPLYISNGYEGLFIVSTQIFGQLEIVAYPKKKPF